MYALRSRFIPAAFAAALMTLSAASALGAPTQKDKEDAQAALAEARIAIGINHFDEAAKALKRADELDPNPQTKMDLADALVSGGRLIDASKVLNGVLTSTPPAPKKLKDAAQKLHDSLDQRIPWMQITVVGPSQDLTSITVDGKELTNAENETPFDPGEHVIAADADDYVAIEKKITLAEGAHENVKLEMQRVGGPRPKKKTAAAVGAAKPAGGAESGGTEAAAPSAPETPKKSGGSITSQPLFIPAVIAGGVGVVGLGVGTAFGVMALNETADLKRSCRGNTCPDTAKVRRLQDASLADGNVSTAMFIVGGAGVAAGGVLLALMLTSSPPKGKEKAFVRPWVGAGQGGVYGSF